MVKGQCKFSSSFLEGAVRYSLWKNRYIIKIPCIYNLKKSRIKVVCAQLFIWCNMSYNSSHNPTYGTAFILHEKASWNKRYKKLRISLLNLVSGTNTVRQTLWKYVWDTHVPAVSKGLCPWHYFGRSGKYGHAESTFNRTTRHECFKATDTVAVKPYTSKEAFYLGKMIEAQ